LPPAGPGIPPHRPEGGGRPAQKKHPHDEEAGNRRQESGEHADPNRPPRLDEDEPERQHPGGNPGDPGAFPAPRDDEGEQGRADAAERRQEGALEDGSELPG